MDGYSALPLPWREDGMSVLDAEGTPVVTPVVIDDRAQWACEARMMIVRDVNGAAAVRALHKEHGPTRNGIHCCLECNRNWPCRTVVALGVAQ